MIFMPACTGRPKYNMLCVDASPKILTPRTPTTALLMHFHFSSKYTSILCKLSPSVTPIPTATLYNSIEYYILEQMEEGQSLNKRIAVEHGFLKVALFTNSGLKIQIVALKKETNRIFCHITFCFCPHFA